MQLYILSCKRFEDTCVLSFLNETPWESWFDTWRCWWNWWLDFKMKILRGWIHINVEAIREYQTALDDGPYGGILNFISAIQQYHTLYQFIFFFFTWRLYIWCENVMLEMNLSLWMSAGSTHESNLNRILMIMIICLWWQCHRQSDDDDDDDC